MCASSSSEPRAPRSPSGGARPSSSYAGISSLWARSSVLSALCLFSVSALDICPALADGEGAGVEVLPTAAEATPPTPAEAPAVASPSGGDSAEEGEAARSAVLSPLEGSSADGGEARGAVNVEPLGAPRASALRLVPIVAQGRLRQRGSGTASGSRLSRAGLAFEWAAGPLGASGRFDYAAYQRSYLSRFAEGGARSVEERSYQLEAHFHYLLSELLGWRWRGAELSLNGGLLSRSADNALSPRQLLAVPIGFSGSLRFSGPLRLSGGLDHSWNLAPSILEAVDDLEGAQQSLLRYRAGLEWRGAEGSLRLSYEGEWLTTERRELLVDTLSFSLCFPL